MSRLVTIESDKTEVKIDLDGGTFSSIIDKRNGEQLQYQGSPNSWKDKDMVIFPFIGAVPEDKYTYRGREYPMTRHGFCRHAPFEIVSKTANEATIAFIQTEETAAAYPFKYEFTLTYRVDDDTVSLTYRVDNRGDDTMYFYLGGHVAMLLDGTDEADGREDTKGNFITLERELTDYYGLGETLIEEIRVGSFKRFEVDKAFMQRYRTLILRTGGDGRLTLTRKSGREIEFTFNSPVIAFWSMEETGKYVCIEPWWGISGAEKNVLEISQKELINSLEAGKSFTGSYKFKIK